ncbi:uncharacterized protein LOC117788195 [Drosophila innubila]|uniref:uncharacterized protein LOC117788195 n=1 Tax=Drosophila innubila TaxID=198719 RepID=UPI00148D48B5|nr:uncharacterized protein LOC117788195 [Drosophila innubila]
MHIRLIVALILSLCFIVKADGATNVKTCALESSCKNVTETSAICLWEEEAGCIRKYASLCHMLIASCRKQMVMSDYSDVYCSLETYLCEESSSNERWTIFYGHEKD